MRRGLIARSPEELPDAALDARLARVRAAMRAESLDALIVHPNTYHPEVGYLVLGDSVVVTEQGCEMLTGTPRELFEVAG